LDLISRQKATFNWKTFTTVYSPLQELEKSLNFSKKKVKNHWTTSKFTKSVKKSLKVAALTVLAKNFKASFAANCVFTLE